MGNHDTFVLQGDNRDSTHSIGATNATNGLKTFVDPGDQVRNIEKLDTGLYSFEVSRDQGKSWTPHEAEEKEFDRVKHMLKPA